MTEFGVRWMEFNHRDERVTKEKFFSSAKARDKFMEKLSKKDNFYQILATCD